MTTLAFNANSVIVVVLATLLVAKIVLAWEALAEFAMAASLCCNVYSAAANLLPQLHCVKVADAAAVVWTEAVNKSAFRRV